MNNFQKVEQNVYKQSVGIKVHSNTHPINSFKALSGTYVNLSPLNLIKNIEELARNLFPIKITDEFISSFTYLPYEAPTSIEDLSYKLSSQFGTQGNIYYVIRIANKPVGWIALMNIGLDDGVVEIGNVYFSADLKRSRAATEVLFLLLNECFTLGFRRIEWKCHELNLASKKAALRFGFQYEGMFRQHKVVKGRNRNTLWFSMLDEEWLTLKESYLAWLEPSNFTQEGQQIKTLQAFYNEKSA